MKALIIGATGAVGNSLLDLLIEDSDFSEVHVFVRRPLMKDHPKLKVHVIDFDHPESWSPLVKGDVVFSCLGTTKRQSGSKEAQWKVDYDYQLNFAKAARENNVEKYILVSAKSANPKSPFFYLRMKGQLEVAVKELHFKHLQIFNPGLLERKNSDRFFEVASANLLKKLNKMGLFKSQAPLPTDELAKSMIQVCKD